MLWENEGMSKFAQKAKLKMEELLNLINAFFMFFYCWRYTEEAMEILPVNNVVVAAYTTAQA